ncbi:hypothetical protein SK128_026293, partial [Halocaridina rubra]
KVNNMAWIRVAHNSLTNQKEAKRKQKECSLRRMREEEQCVQNLITCINELDSYPFDPDVSDYGDGKDDDVQGRKGNSSGDDDSECSDSD